MFTEKLFALAPQCKTLYTERQMPFQSPTAVRKHLVTVLLKTVNKNR